MRSITLLVISLPLGFGTSFAGLKTVITAVPKTRCYMNADSAHCEPVDPENQQGLRLTMMREGTGLQTTYYWVVNGQPREIEKASLGLGPYDVYVEAGGMVVIYKTAEAMKAMGMLAPEGPHPNFRYMELTRSGLSTITYYGEATSYDP